MQRAFSKLEHADSTSKTVEVQVMSRSTARANEPVAMAREREAAEAAESMMTLIVDSVGRAGRM